MDDKSLDQEFNTTLMDLQMQGVNMNKIKGGKQGQQRVAEAVAMESANRLLTRRTLERLKAIATGEYKDESIDKVKNEEAGGQVKTRKTETSKKGSPKSGKTTKASASKKPGSGSKSKPTIKKSPSKK